jgi:hypothetical protein
MEKVMSYVVLWLAHLTFSVLLVATVVALASRCKKPRWRRFWPILVTVLVSLPLLIAAITGGFLLVKRIQPTWLFGYGLSQIIVYLALVVITLKRGLRGYRSEDQQARHWPRTRLAMASLLVLIIYFGTLNFIEVRGMVEMANVRTEATAKITSLLPATLPDTFNAHPSYEQAIRILGPRNKLPDWFGEESDKPYFDPASEQVETFLSNHQTAIAKTRRAVSLPGYSIAVDASDFFNSPIPRYSGYLDLARVLSLSARAEALSGNPTAALQDLAIIEGMSEHLRSFPLLISLVVAGAVEQIRVQGLEDVLSHSPDLAPGLIDLPVALHPSVINSLLKTQRMEAYAILQIMAKTMFSDDLFVSGGILPDVGHTGQAILAKLWRVFFLPSELKGTKGIIAYRMAKPEQSYADILNNWKAIDEALKSGELGIIAAIATPSLSAYVTRTMRYEALTRLADTAMAAAAFKAANGSYPASLEDLVPDYLDQIPVDPFDLEPLKLRSIDGGLDLYSVGADLNSLPSRSTGPIHFYLGKAAYDQYRVKPSREEKQKKEQQKSKRKKRKRRK